MSIRNRTVFYVQPKGKQVRFTGWARVTTSLGTMVEPFTIGDLATPNRNRVDADASDPIARIDKLQQVAFDEAPFYDGEGEKRRLLHGGGVVPRTTIATGNFND